MTRNLLVGIAETAEVTPPRQFLVDLVRDLRELDVRTQVAAFAPGPVVDALAEVADVCELEPLPRRSPPALVQAAARRLSPELALRVQDVRTRQGRRRLRPPDAIHLVGARAMPLLRYVRSPDVPVTTYVHPWDYSIAGLPPRDRRELISRTRRFLVADDSVVGPLLDAGVPPERIMPAPDTVPPLPDLPPDATRRAAARAAHGLTADRGLVVLLRVPGWAELPDPTLSLVWEVRRRLGQPPSFVWYGVPEPDDHDLRWPIDHEVAHLALDELELVVDDRPPWDELAELADAVVLPSNAPDDLPVGFARLASRGATPVLCWDDHPRAADVAAWGGTVVPRGDVTAMADALATAFASPAAQREARSAAWAPFTAEFDALVAVGVQAP